MKKCETRLKLQRRPLVDSPARTPDHQAGNRETSQSFKDTVGREELSTLSGTVLNTVLKTVPNREGGFPPPTPRPKRLEQQNRYFRQLRQKYSERFQCERRCQRIYACNRHHCQSRPTCSCGWSSVLLAAWHKTNGWDHELPVGHPKYYRHQW
jgi:hypothetical protein